MRWSVTGGARVLRPAARRAADRAVALGADPDRRDHIELAVHELLANALEHGHGGDPDLAIGIRVARSGAGPVTVEVTDHAVAGPFQAPAPARPARGVDPCRGRGRQLVEAVATSSSAGGDDAGATVVRIELPTLHAGPDSGS